MFLKVSQGFEQCRIAWFFKNPVYMNAYICMHRVEIICFFESYLNYNILTNDSNLQIPGYNFVRVDHPSNANTAVCVCTKKVLWLWKSYMYHIFENLEFVRELLVINSEFELTTIHATSPVFVDLLAIQKMNLRTNARLQDWHQNDITTSEGSKINITAPQFSLSQIIKNLTNIFNNLACCIDLTFAS